MYKQTKNLLLVKEKLGHAKVETSMIYLQLFEEGEPDYVCEIALTPEQGVRLIEQGFQFVCEIEGKYLFKKLK